MASWVYRRAEPLNPLIKNIINLAAKLTLDLITVIKVLPGRIIVIIKKKKKEKSKKLPGCLLVSVIKVNKSSTRAQPTKSSQS